jgi:hypothetical protein
MSEAIRLLHRRIENEIWSVVLPWMETNRIVRWTVSSVDQFSQALRTPEFWVRCMLAASAGLWLGIAIGMIIAVFY